MLRQVAKDSYNPMFLLQYNQTIVLIARPLASEVAFWGKFRM